MDNVLVTGASRGLGLEIARMLARSGYRILAVSREKTEDLSVASQEAEKGGLGEIQLEPFDLADVDGVPKFVAALREVHGPIYGLVNNAAISAEGLLATLPNSQIERILRVNTLSPIILSKYVSRGMMAAGRGRIVTISSIVASTGFRALSVYSASKASLIGFTRSLARELGPLGITVNAVAPGFLETSMTQSFEEKSKARVIKRSALGRLATVEDVAHAVDYLLSEKARNVTGTVMTIDAGGTA